MKQFLLTILKYLFTLSIALGLLWYVFKDLSIADMISQLGTVQFGWIYLSIALSILSHVFRAYRWQLLIAPLNYSIPLRTSFWAVMIGYLASLAFPRMGEITKCGVIKRTHGIKMSASMGTVVTERIFDVLILLIILFVTFLVEFDRLNEFFIELFRGKIPDTDCNNLLEFAIVAGVLLFIFVIIGLRYKSLMFETRMFQKFKTSIIHFKEGLLSVRKIENVYGFIVSTIGIWILYYLMAYVIVFSIPETVDLDWIAGLAILVVGGIAMSAPVQGGIGTYHFLVGTLLTLYAIKPETGVFFATLLHTSQTLAVMTLGSIGLIVISLTKRFEEKEPDD